MIHTGDRVYITYAGKTVEGVCILASSNGRSLMLAFDALLGGFAGMLPVLMDESGEYRDIVNDRPCVVTPNPCPAN